MGLAKLSGDTVHYLCKAGVEFETPAFCVTGQVSRGWEHCVVGEAFFLS